MCITRTLETICPLTCILPPQISCVSSSSELSDRQRFRYYFQMLGTETDLAIGFFGIIKQFEWRKVAFIEQNENLFTVVSYLLVEVYIAGKLILPSIGCE